MRAMGNINIIKEMIEKYGNISMVELIEKMKEEESRKNAD